LWLLRLVTVLFGGLLVAGLAACGSDDSAAGSSGARRLAEPVTVEHKFGKTTITEVPRRIVTIDSCPARSR